MMARHAECSCGQLRVETRGEPIRISICHCLACQRRTGSAFAAQARFARTDVMIGGRSSRYQRVADSGKTASFFFCPECGSTVHYRIDDQPDVVAIPLGAFADPSFPAPTVSVYEGRRHRWLQLDASIERHD